MAWVTWRQHRPQAIVGLAMLAAIGVAGLISSLPIRAAYHRNTLVACLPPSTRSGCDIIIQHFQSDFLTGVDAARGLMLVPALIGLFVGAPLLAREFEHGTYRLAWTQGVTRQRWLLQKTLFLSAATVAATAALSALTMWWRTPFDTFAGRIAPAGFDVEGLVVPAYAVFALAVGVLAGLLLRRTVPAMTMTLVAFVATRFVVERFVRPHFLSPLHEVASGAGSVTRARDWVLSAPLVDATGRGITSPREDSAILHAQQAHIDPHEYLATLGWHRVVSFQPADRFWTFQAIETGIFVALAAAVVALTIWALRRIPA